MVCKSSRALLFFVAALLFAILPASAEKRVALVVGNGAYKSAPALANPANDAAAVADLLRKMGYEVYEGRDLTRNEMASRLGEFARALRSSEVALFFYAGHGVQVGGKNYLLPIDAVIENPSDLRLHALDVDGIIEDMDSRRGANLIFLDACRDNPFTRSLARAMSNRSSTVGAGLASTHAGVGTLIAYATQPNATASDGDGHHSPFTAALLRYLATPGLEVRSMLTRVRSDVVRDTGSRQVPWDHSSLLGDLYLAGASQEKGDTAQVQRASATAERVAALPPLASGVSPGASMPEAQIKSLPRSIQLELVRLGCGPSKVTREWGPSAREALRRFNNATRSTGVLTPSDDLLRRLTALDARACPEPRAVRAPPAVDKKRPPAQSNQALARAPPAGAVRAGSKVIVDDGSCPRGQVKEITGGNTQLRVPRKVACVTR